MIIDNKLNFLYEIFQKNDIEQLQILTPFTTLYGFELIQKKLSIFDMDEVDEENIIGEKIKVLIKDIDTIRWRQDLEEDLKLLNSLLLKTERIDTYKDNKLKQLKNIIKSKINLLKKELKQAVNLNEKVEINMELYKLKDELNRLKEKT